MTKNKLKCVLLITVFGLSCNRGINEDNTSLLVSIKTIRTIKVKDPDNYKILHLSSFVKEEKMIPLEITKSSTLGNINKVVIQGNSIFISDKDNPNSIFVFDITGKFSTLIGKKGQGPGEHIDLTDFSIDQTTGQIYLYDQSQRKIIRYDKGGKFIDEIFTDYFGEHFEYNYGFIYQYRTNPSRGLKYNLVIKDRESKTLATYIKAIPEGQNLDNKIFSKASNKIFLNPSYSDTIYALKNTKLEYAYVMDFGKYNLSKKNHDKIFASDQNARTIPNKIDFASLSDGVFDFNNFFFFKFIFHNQNSFGYYDKVKKQATVSSNIIDDISYLRFIEPISQTSNQLMSIYPMSAVIDDISFIQSMPKANKNNPEAVTNAINLLISYKQKGVEKLNPMLILYTIK